MNCKKFFAGALSAAIAFSTMSFSAFAASTLTLNVVQDAAAAGGTVTVKLPFTDMGKAINAITIDLEYDDEAFEYVSTTYGVYNLMENKTDNVGDGLANGKVSYSKDDTNNTSTSGDLITATFRVRSDATGGDKDFNITCAQVGNNDGTWMFDTTGGDTVTKDSITIQAPEPLAAPTVSIDSSAKTASWGAVAHAKDYKVVLYKDGTSVYETTTTETNFDFSKKVDISAEYKVGVTALQSETLYTTSAEGTADETITVASTVTPDSKAYVTGSGAINFTLGENGNELTSVKCGTDDVTYTNTNGIVTIQEADIKAGTYSFEFSYNGAVVNTVNVNITVTEAADSAVLVFAEKEKTEGEYQTDDDTVYNDGSNDGLIVVTNGSQPVKGFLGAQFSINNAAAAGFDPVKYEIVPADGFSLLYDEDLDIYEINVKPVNGKAPNIEETDNGKGIVIGKLVRKGNSYGKGTISASAILITVEKSDNTYKKLNGTNLSFQYDIPEPTETLNVNVDFTLPTLTSNAADYQNMTVNLYSARLGNIELALAKNDGTAPVYTSEDGKITATLTSSDNKYALAVKGLPKFEAYTVSIKGDGYRDAKAQFVLNEETTVNFWNNAYDTEVPFITKASEKKFDKVNFLAGDIIMNGTIDLYDLSAVSSYYGKSGLTAEDKDYIQYDLNRDGKVDLIDITMLLAGWAR